jgi:hypothetical protein
VTVWRSVVVAVTVVVPFVVHEGEFCETEPVALDEESPHCSLAARTVEVPSELSARSATPAAIVNALTVRRMVFPNFVGRMSVSMWWLSRPRLALSGMPTFHRELADEAAAGAANCYEGLCDNSARL